MRLLKIVTYLLPLSSVVYADLFSFDSFIKDVSSSFDSLSSTIHNLGNDAKEFADSKIKDVLSAASPQVKEAEAAAAGLMDAVNDLVREIETRYAEQQRLVARMGASTEDLTKHFALELEDARAGLQKELAVNNLPPAPEEETESDQEEWKAGGKEGATGGKKGNGKPKAWQKKLYADVSTILDRIEDAAVKVCGIWHAAEADVRANFAPIKPHLQTVMVFAGTVAHEHPHLFKILLPLPTGILIPFVPHQIALVLFDIFALILADDVFSKAA